MYLIDVSMSYVYCTGIIIIHNDLSFTSVQRLPARDG